MVFITTSKWFDRFILGLIIANSICLGCKDYLDTDNESYINQKIESFDIFFTTAFCIEAIVKIIAMGFISGHRAYMRDAWNWLDLTVVASSLLSSIPSLKHIQGLKTFRLFRPLRSLNNMPSMRILVETLFMSIKALSGVMGLALFFFSIFAILGIS